MMWLSFYSSDDGICTYLDCLVLKLSIFSLTWSFSSSYISSSSSSNESLSLSISSTSSLLICLRVFYGRSRFVASFVFLENSTISFLNGELSSPNSLISNTFESLPNIFSHFSLAILLSLSCPVSTLVFFLTGDVCSILLMSIAVLNVLNSSEVLFGARVENLLILLATSSLISKSL